MKNVCVIGTGISGSTIANLLSKKYKVDVYEKAKGIGGRSSYRRYLNNFGKPHSICRQCPSQKDKDSLIDHRINVVKK